MARPLRVGDPLPAFAAQEADGRTWTERDVAGRAFVLYFYPKDETPGCIVEACAYRDAWDDFQAAGVLVIGVSRDDLDAHRRFVAHRMLPFTLLSDGEGAMHDAFGATMLGGLPRRVSYLFGPDGRVAAVFDSHLRPEAHAHKMLDAARHLGFARA
ncbi:MAG: thioredoxin-dependent peroxiredoxin [Thermoplasmata archaeon]|nr:thioredoxin-dependent peroxiredoxin [Thermoplasmata archaeon]